VSLYRRSKKIDYAQHVENKKRLHSTFWGNAMLICRLDIPFFGAHLMQTSELHIGGTIYSFAVRKSHKEVLVNFGCNGDVHWAELSNGLSTEWKLTPKTSNK